jgi:hypothetical protein
MIKTIQDDPKKMNMVITMFTDLANMYREFKNENGDSGFNAEETADIFSDLMSTIFGQQNLELANEMFAETLIAHKRAPNFWIYNDKIREKRDGTLSQIP